MVSLSANNTSNLNHKPHIKHSILYLIYDSTMERILDLEDDADGDAGSDDDKFLSVNDIVPFIHLPEGRHRPKQEDTSSTFASFKSGGGGGSRAGSDSDNSDDLRARIIQNKYLEKDLTTKGGDTATAGVSGKDHNDALGDLQEIEQRHQRQNQPGASPTASATGRNNAPIIHSPEKLPFLPIGETFFTAPLPIGDTYTFDESDLKFMLGYDVGQSETESDDVPSMKRRKTGNLEVESSCSIEGCTKQARKAGLCWTHGMKRQCAHEGCTNAAIKGGVCVPHGAKFSYSICNQEGCTKYAQKRGLCISHGAKVKLCSKEGCTKYAQKGGVCIGHGAKVKKCTYEGCSNNAKKRGLCCRHGA